MSTRSDIDTLPELQARFAHALQDTAGVDALAARLVPASLEIDRIGLYRGNLHAHRRGALANAYPVLLALVGDAYFDGLARAYGAAYPSLSGDLNQFGSALGDFLATYETDARFAYFGDVAKLDWALHQAHYAADVIAFTADEWAAVGERLLDSGMTIHPACVALASSYAIADIWHAHQPGGVFPDAVERPSYALVVRPGWRATVLRQSEAAHRAWIALQQGQTLNDALDAAFALDEAFDFPTQWRTWIEAHAITGTVGPPST